MATSVVCFLSSRHEGPVWQLSWSHPTFGSLLASCSYDRKVLIWKETTSTGLPPQSNTPGGGTLYTIIYEYERHTSSGNERSLVVRSDRQSVANAYPHVFLVNTVAWAPYEYGLMLACGSSDGAITIISSTGEHFSLGERSLSHALLGDGRWTTKKIPDCHPVCHRSRREKRLHTVPFL